jgi:uncharacterized protein YkwD
VSRYLYVCLLLAALFVPAVRTTAHAAAPAAVDPIAARIVELVNQQRAVAHLAPVTMNETWMAEAQRFSGVQASLGYLSHRGVDGTTAGQRLTRAGYRWRFYGENLAAGFETPDQVVAAWMASPGHRANILTALATEIGVGHTFRPDDPARYFDYWAVELARPY